MNKPRAFIADHMAVLPYGHNTEALRLFGTALAARGLEVTTLVCTHLPRQIAGTENFARVLTYPYNGQTEALFKYRNFPRTAAPLPSKLVKHASRQVWQSLAQAGWDAMAARVRRDWRRAIARWRIGAGDLVFLPSADHYGLLGLLDVLTALPPDRRPAVHARLIGVMETVSYAPGTARTRLLRAVRAVQAAGVNVALSAETPVYRDYLSTVMGQDVGYLTYPCIAAWTPVNWEARPFRLTSPGQGRIDKGYRDLLALSDALKPWFVRGEAVLTTQAMRKDDYYYNAGIEARLAAKIDMEVLPARLDAVQIDQLYRDAHVLVLPYLRTVYALRGSAVYQEGLAHGRPVVTYDGTGIASMVERYGNGICVKDERAMAEALHHLSQRPEAWVHDITRRARAAYSADFDASLDAVLETAGRPVPSPDRQD